MNKLQAERVVNNGQSMIIDNKPIELLDAILFLRELNKQEFCYNNTKVSIIIPVYNQWEMTHHCIQSIFDNTKGINYEIIIADDCSPEQVVIQYPNIIHIRNKKNLGFVLNCNNAAKSANGEYIVILNNDTLVKHNWLKHLLDTIRKDSSIGIVGGKLLNRNGTCQDAGGIIFRDGSAAIYCNEFNKGSQLINYVKEVDYISGACLLISKDLWDGVNGFDERYVPAYCEDSDLCFKVRAAGYKVVYQPLCEVTHIGGASHGVDTKKGIKSYQPINQKKLAEKWKSELLLHSEYGEDIAHRRERSDNKETILVVDYSIPMYDTNAGNRTTWQYMDLMLEIGFNVKFLPITQSKDCIYDKYILEMQQKGIELIMYGQNYLVQWLRDYRYSIDYIYLNRPQSYSLMKFLKLNVKTAKFIYYGHDLQSLRLLRQFETSYNEEFLQQSIQVKNAELEIFNTVDKICYPSIIEKEFIEKENSDLNIEVIPPYIYSDYEPISGFVDRNDIMFCGCNFAPNIDGLKWFINDIFPIVGDLGIKFYIVGIMPEEITDLQTDNIICLGYLTDNELKELYNKCRLSVIPLRYGAGIKGKTIEAMYYGIPIVSTDIANEGIPQLNHAVNSTKDFANRLIELYNSGDNELMTIAKSNRQIVKEYYSKDKCKDIINKLFTLEQTKELQ